MKFFILQAVLLLSSFAFAGELAALKNSFVSNPPVYGAKKNAKNTAPAEVQISVLSESEAQNLFREFVKHKEIPFKYPKDGCFARAHAMARIADKNEIVMGKIFAEGSLIVKTQLTKYPIAHWGWHVAPVTYVKKDDGTMEIMVFDPSMFNKPVSVEEWENKMLYNEYRVEPEIKSVYYGSRYQLHRKNKEAYKSTWDLTDDEVVAYTFEEYSPLQDLTATMNQNPQSQEPSSKNSQTVHQQGVK